MASLRSRSTLLLLIALCAAAFLQTAHAQVAVKATLSERVAEVGEPVQLQVEITGGSDANQPPDVNVEGLEIRYSGPSRSQQINMINGQITRQVSTTHIYQVVPKRTGDFTIPALAVEVDGQTYQTRPVGLKVGKGAGAQEKFYSLEMHLPKKTLYVGEVVPVELRFYIAARVPAQIESTPQIEGEGFTKQKMPQPQQQTVERNGTQWQAVIFKTAITPSRAGKISLGPAEVSFVAQAPRRQRRARDPFESFFGRDLFDSAFGEQRRYTARAEAVELDVKPLPVDGRPKDFSGAVGLFSFTAEGKPDRVKIGDPLTMRLVVKGSGNFDRMQAPALADSTGWRVYPASENFEAADELNVTGTKTFEMPVVPEQPHDQMPSFAFSFFDPDKETYVTLTSAPAPLVVEGNAPPAPAPAPARQPQSTRPAEPAAAAAQPPPSDILGIQYEFGKARSTFAPLYEQRVFWLAQLVPLGILVALLGARVLRRDAQTARLADLRRERDRLWQQLRRGSDGADFYEKAARVVQLETALSTGAEPASVDAAAAQRSRTLDQETSDGLDEIFGSRAELLYAGAGPAPAALSPNDRARVLATLERFMKSHA